MSPTDPAALTAFAELHGCSCKVDQGELDELLTEVGLTEPTDDLLLGVGEDAAARQLTDEIALVSTIDFFTPIADDPVDFGRIAACNAASDAFATGAIDNIGCLVILGLPRELIEQAEPILRGMRSAIEGMDGSIVGGHTVLNPWPLAGGAITATAHPSNLLSSATAQPGDLLYLTKPLGTQPAMGAMRVSDGKFVETVARTAPRPIDRIGKEAIDWMTTPNADAARVVRQYANAATDVTGFGLAGQAGHLARRSGVGIEISSIPVIPGTPELSDLFGYGLRQGESAETSGGLLASVPAHACDEIESAFDAAGIFYRQIGRVSEGEGASLTNGTVDPVDERPTRPLPKP